MRYAEAVTNFIRMLRETTSRPIGDNDVPDELAGRVLSNDDYPYAIAYQIPGGYLDGPMLERKDSHVDIPVQVTSVGRTREQAHWMGDAVREAVLSQNGDGSYERPVAGVTARDISEAGGIDAEGTGENRTYSYPCTYLLRILE